MGYKHIHTYIQKGRATGEKIYIHTYTHTHTSFHKERNGLSLGIGAARHIQVPLYLSTEHGLQVVDGLQGELRVDLRYLHVPRAVSGYRKIQELLKN